MPTYKVPSEVTCPRDGRSGFVSRIAGPGDWTSLTITHFNDTGSCELTDPERVAFNATLPQQ